MIGISKIKTALWVPRYWPAIGGTELHTRRLAKELSSEFDVEIVTQCTTSEHVELPLEYDASVTTARSYMEGSVQVHRLGMNKAIMPVLNMLARKHRQLKVIRFLYSGFFFSSFYRQTSKRTDKLDLIHFVYNGLTDSAILAATIAKRRNIPFVFTPNILDTSDHKHAWNSARFQFLYKFSSRIIALTSHEARWLEKQNVPAEKISVIPYGPILKGDANGERFRKTTNIGEEKIVLFLARIIPLKGYKLVLDACEKIWCTHPTTRIVFMGPATPESRDDILRSQDPRILLLENFNQELKADALAACDLLCVPSKKESLGVVYIEAAFSAKPVVALDLPVLREVIEHNVNGLLVDECATSVAGAIETILSNPEKSKKMGLHGQLEAFQRFSWSTIKSAMSTTYKEVVAERRLSSETVSTSNTSPFSHTIDVTKYL